MPTLAEALKLADRVGIEVEYTDLNLANIPGLQKFIHAHGYAVVHDASVESPSLFLDNRPVKGSTFSENLNRDLFRKTTIGGEIVTDIIDSDDKSWIGIFDKIFSELKLAGERPNSPRGSIHVHVNVARPNHYLELLLVSWILAGHFESFFYRMGCMGKSHRGENMDFIYYRPITGLYPPVVDDSAGRQRFLLDFDEVLKSNSVDDFFYRCGGILDAQNRYHPSRYMWINYYNMNTRFSPIPHLEFRVFNKTLRWDYLLSAVELCKAFVKLAIKLTAFAVKEYKDLQAIVENIQKAFPLCAVSSPIENPDLHFEKTMQELEITGNIKLLLRDVWTNSEYVDIPKRLILSHLDRRIVFLRDEHNPPLVKSKVFFPDFYDVHRLEREGAVIFPEEP